ncbi:MAG: PssD/Cps14F family polysaccharide biosynthesis glycosyltransferase [Methanobacteriaceae archaeon]
MKICLECAEGGHLDEMLNIIEAFEGNELFFITTKAPSTEGLADDFKVYYTRRQYETRTKMAIYFREFLLIFKLIFRIFMILRKEKPKVIVSTGGGSTIPLCYWGKIFGIKIIYIESLARVNSPSLTGKIVHPITDIFLVQWKSMLQFYKRAEFWGRSL